MVDVIGLPQTFVEIDEIADGCQYVGKSDVRDGLILVVSDQLHGSFLAVLVFIAHFKDFQHHGIALKHLFIFFFDTEEMSVFSQTVENILADDRSRGENHFPRFWIGKIGRQPASVKADVKNAVENVQLLVDFIAPDARQIIAAVIEEAPRQIIPGIFRGSLFAGTEFFIELFQSIVSTEGFVLFESVHHEGAVAVEVDDFPVAVQPHRP